MPSLVLALLLALLPAQGEGSRYLPKSAISSPVFGPRQVYGLVNGSVTVRCFYPPTSVNRHDRKYWCKLWARGCETIVSTSSYTAPGYRGRASITDDPQAHAFQITVSQLSAADAGTYQCGVGINGRGLSHRVSLDVSEGPPLPEGAELFYAELHSTLTMSCSFGEEAASERKFLCRMGKAGCHNIIDSTGDIDEDYTGRILLSNDDTPGSFRVLITQIGWEDSGFYLCGFGFYGESGETKELDVHVYERSGVPQRRPSVVAVKGSSATFECHYEPLRSSSTKYWCKWREKGCARIIDSSGFVSPSYEGRVAMFENPANKTFTVILNQLKDGDQGYYWCMTDEEREQQSSTELKVIDGEPGLQGKKEVEAQAGSRVELTCSYPCKYYSYQKYWCSWGNATCSPLAASDRRQPGPDVACDTDNRTVLLSFDPVTRAEQGWYWCGVKRGGDFGETMAVYLTVTEGELRDLELLNAEDTRRTEDTQKAEGGSIPEGRASSDAGVPGAAGSGRSDDSQGPHALTLSLSVIGAALVVLMTAFAVFKYWRFKRSDLVSVGSYRTNISLSDLDGASSSSSARGKDNMETSIGGDELITTAATPESAAEPKKAKRSSKEDADLAYSTFLFTSS
ncbi:PIGR protein, partial [Rhinopomastus cyanomelas]|nr:PIGR protein [Rhinopomastus cyanomelas]